MSILDTARAEALFASDLQPSSKPDAAAVRAAIDAAILKLGVQGCACRVADEFGEHPLAAVARMRWSIVTVGVTFARATRRAAGTVARDLVAG
jgi:hypothetical protein